MRIAHIVTDLQFGSTGKGAFIGYLAAESVQPDAIFTAWGPNAGHTFIDRHGNKMVHTMLGSGCVSPNLRYVMIGPGSVIDSPKLHQEIYEARAMGYMKNATIIIHENAAILFPSHSAVESGYGFKIGSTMKGTGAAVMQKMRRDPDSMNVAKRTDFSNVEWNIVDTEGWNDIIDYEINIGLVEGSQGYSLGINSGFYPYVTSRECTTAQIVSDLLLPYGMPSVVYGVARTYPIRVANRFRDGIQVGTSGPCYADQKEITWDQIGRETELTTVTKLPRRLFTFSREQVRMACRVNAVDYVFLNFANYLRTKDEVIRMVNIIQESGTKVGWIGTGPTLNDIHATEEYIRESPEESSVAGNRSDGAVVKGKGVPGQEVW